MSPYLYGPQAQSLTLKLPEASLAVNRLDKDKTLSCPGLRLRIVSILLPIYSYTSSIRASSSSFSIPSKQIRILLFAPLTEPNPFTTYNTAVMVSTSPDERHAHATDRSDMYALPHRLDGPLTRSLTGSTRSFHLQTGDRELLPIYFSPLEGRTRDADTLLS
jgi:hypothetical protein